MELSRIKHLIFYIENNNDRYFLLELHLENIIQRCKPLSQKKNKYKQI